MSDKKYTLSEAISKADSVSEAKTVYETLINSVGGPAERQRAPKSLNEAINKNSSFRFPHKQAEQPHDPNKDQMVKISRYQMIPNIFKELENVSY